MNKEISYTDERLIELAQQGDIKAYNALLERYYPKIQQMIYFYINDKANVKDLTQEVLLKVYRYLSTFNGESQFSTWLHRITHNTVKNYFRSLSLRIDSELKFASEYSSSINQPPECQLMNSELGEQLELAIEKLSEELRLCYGMHIFEGHTYEDIAKEMSCPLGTVRSRIFRARKLMASYVGHIAADR
jgi:RNA polymerase sigma-70 factor (ECF subfamily)